MTHWEPTASIETLKARAAFLKKIRQFFDERDVLEVETPLMAKFGVTDLHLDNFETSHLGKPRYLQTSPEYHMKRLLAAGSPSIFQLSKAFRNEPSGKQHNPEFTMLEWYRLDFDIHQLMDEVALLIETVLGQRPVKHYTYQSLFIQTLDLCPFKATIKALEKKAKGIALVGALKTKDDWLALLMTHLIEPSLKEQGVVFVYDYPPSQASLATVEKGVAKRFECYVEGIELANGFHELCDSGIQNSRFDEDNKHRAHSALPQKEKDLFLLQALASGLPACSGVALGIDRLLMLALNKQDISKVISFSSENA